MAATAALDLRKVNVKVSLKTTGAVNWRPFINVFHRWIQDTKLKGVLVDVAEYTHVTDGPQVLLLAHEGQWVLDTEEGRPGMLYSQRHPPEGSAEHQLKRALKECLTGCKLLEQEPEAKDVLTVDTSTIEITANDRAMVPNDAESRTALESVIKTVLGNAVKLAPETDPRKRCGFIVTGATSMNSLLNQL